MEEGTTILGGKSLCGKCAAVTPCEHLSLTSRRKNTLLWLCPGCMDAARKLWVNFMKSQR